MKASIGVAAALASLLHVAPAVAATGPGYHQKVAVSAPTRLDWTFVLTNRSLDPPPAGWLPDYDSRKQHYELYVPPRRDRKKPLPVILFISPSDQPMGWKPFARLCKQQGFLFAGPHGAGNDCEQRKRVRIVLDVLDDVRRNYPTDPDRTYVAGFSGGGRMALAVGCALPELFGGILPIGAGGFLRNESWLRQRAIDRLSVALLTGTGDFNRAEVERFRGPQLKDVGVRTRVWVQPGLGHAIPPDAVILAAIRWLEGGTRARQTLAKKYPAMRLAGDAAPTRGAQARALLDEGKKRLEEPATAYSGLMLLKGCMERWPDLEEGRAARKILLEYDARTERPWDKDDIAEQRRFLIAEARALSAYASGPLRKEYAKMRPDMIQRALELWRKIQADAPDSPAGREANKLIPALEKLAGSKK